MDALKHKREKLKRMRRLLRQLEKRLNLPPHDPRELRAFIEEKPPRRLRQFIEDFEIQNGAGDYQI